MASKCASPSDEFMPYPIAGPIACAASPIRTMLPLDSLSHHTRYPYPRDSYYVNNSTKLATQSASSALVYNNGTSSLRSALGWSSLLKHWGLPESKPHRGLSGPEEPIAINKPARENEANVPSKTDFSFEARAAFSAAVPVM